MRPAAERENMKIRITASLLAGLLFLSPGSHAQDAPVSAPSAAKSEATSAPVDVQPRAAGVRRAMVVCGLAGDAEHRELFAESVELLVTGLTTKHGFAAEHVALYWSDEPTDKDGPALAASRGVTTRESLTTGAEAMRTALGPDDTLWVFVFGHSHYDGRHAWLNISGPDINHLEFGRLFEGLRCREQVFAIIDGKTRHEAGPKEKAAFVAALRARILAERP